MKRFRPSFYPLLLALLCLAQSCISDNTGDCNPTNTRDIKIYFQVDIDTYADPSMADQINRMNLFVFDQTGAFVGEWIDENPVFQAGYYMTIQLNPGTYTFVTWAGLKTSYIVDPDPLQTGITNIQDANVSLIRPSNGLIDTKPNPLFFARLDDCLVQNQSENFSLTLQQNIYTINISTTGLLASNDDYKIEIKDDNGAYKFDNSFAPSLEYYYTDQCTKDALNQPMGSLNVLRLQEARKHPIFTLTNTTSGQEMYQANLIELILKLRELGETVDFDTMHTFDIQLDFGNTNLNVGVSINGWVVVENDSEM